MIIFGREIFLIVCLTGDIFWFLILNICILINCKILQYIYLFTFVIFIKKNDGSIFCRSYGNFEATDGYSFFTNSALCRDQTRERGKRNFDQFLIICYGELWSVKDWKKMPWHRMVDFSNCYFINIRMSKSGKKLNFFNITNFKEISNYILFNFHHHYIQLHIFTLVYTFRHCFSTNFNISRRFCGCCLWA